MQAAGCGERKQQKQGIDGVEVDIMRLLSCSE
jgi:hypothetical protein